jgi:hypothetical protein
VRWDSSDVAGITAILGLVFVICFAIFQARACNAAHPAFVESCRVACAPQPVHSADANKAECECK